MSEKISGFARNSWPARLIRNCGTSSIILPKIKEIEQDLQLLRERKSE